MAVAKTMQPAPVKPHLMETIDVQPNNRVAAKFLYKKNEPLPYATYATSYTVLAFRLPSRK